jgi:hypothetical protein
MTAIQQYAMARRTWAAAIRRREAAEAKVERVLKSLDPAIRSSLLRREQLRKSLQLAEAALAKANQAEDAAAHAASVAAGYAEEEQQRRKNSC